MEAPRRAGFHENHISDFGAWIVGAASCSGALLPLCHAGSAAPRAGCHVGITLKSKVWKQPFGVSSHDICPPPWQIGHWRISSSAIQRCVGLLQRMFALQTNPIMYDSIVAHFILQLLHKVHKSGTRLFPAVFALSPVIDRRAHGP
jgi:hypothetical protein